jgi:hypothetical protein
MSTYRIALVAATATAVLWSAKATAIGLAGGLDRSPLESPLFLAGLLASVTAVVSLALHLTRARPVWQRAVTAAAAVAAAVGSVPLLTGLVDTLASPSPTRHWAWSEVNLWAFALALVVAVLVSRPRTAAARRPVRRAPVPSPGH